LEIDMNIIDHNSSTTNFKGYHCAEAYLACEAEHLIRLHDADPSGDLYLVTGTFPGRRFKGYFDARGGRYQTMIRTERFCDELMRTFRLFYIKMLERTVPDFRKRRAKQPNVLAFIDDKQGADHYLHIHSVWHVPTAVLTDVRQWLHGAGDAGAKSEWRKITEGGQLDVAQIKDTDEDIRHACSYSGKLLPRAEALGVPSGSLCRILPD
jgi:hypothetical protein